MVREMAYKWMVALAALAFSCVLLAGQAQPVSEDPALEDRVNRISEQLRCLVCQNQTIADSHADLAIDLKNQVRDMLKRGMDEKAVTDFMVHRYGDFVLYNPPVKPTTWLLWLGPFALFIAVLWLLFVKLRNRRQQIPEGLTEQQHRQAQALLQGAAADTINSSSTKK